MVEDVTPKRRKNVAAICCAVLALGVLALLALGLSERGDPAERPPVTVSSEALASAFADNPIGAQDRYGDRPVVISGTVDEIGVDRSHPLVDLLPGPGIVLAMTPIGAEGAGQLRRGQPATMRCAFLVAGDKPTLSDCVLQ